VLLPDTALSAIRQKATANTPQWQAFKNSLDSNLNTVIPGGYQASGLGWIADYALGYEVLKTTDPTTAAKYADKAIAVIKSGLRDYQKGDWTSRQYLARGDGTTTSFVLPNSDIVPSSVTVYVSDISTVSIVHGPANGADPVGYYAKFIKVSNTPDGSPNYTEGTDWTRNGDLSNNLIDWSKSGAEPAVGATYYVTDASEYATTPVGFSLNGHTVTLNTAPTANQAVFVQYVYGTHAADGSTLAYQQTSAGDGGFSSIFIDTTYTSRYLGKYIAIGYDWLSDYAGYSSALKAETANMLVRWSDYIRDHGYYNNYPSSNYGAGGYVSRMLTAVALSDQGDSNAARLISEMTTYRTNYLLPVLQDDTASLKGGFWAEGWNYGILGTENLLLAGLAYEEAGLGQATPERQWASQVIESLVTAQPTQATVYDGGDGFAYPLPFPGKELIGVLSFSADSSTDRGYANYVLQNYPSPFPAVFSDLLYRDPTATTSFWNDLPLQRLNQGTGLITARNDWNYNSTWVSFQLGNLLSADHQSISPGQVEIQRGADSLLINANALFNNQDPFSKTGLSNMVVVDDNGDGAQNYRFNVGFWWGTPGVVMTGYEATEDYVYSAGDYHAAYSLNLNPGAGGPATQLTRQIVYLRPDFVIVHDRAATTKDTYPKQLRWHFLNAPSVSGNSWVETVNNSKLFGQTFSASPLATTTHQITGNGTTASDVITTNANPQTSVRYTTAMQSAPSSTGAMVNTARVASTDGQMEGVQMADQVVLFGTNGQVDASNSPVSYSVVGTSAFTHLLVDLKPRQVYTIWAGTSTKVLTSSDQGTLTFSTNASSGGILSVTFQEGEHSGPAFVRDLGSISADTTSWAGVTVASLIGGAMTDADVGAVQGVAVTQTVGTGTWQYCAPGSSTWMSMNGASSVAARLLPDTYMVRFIPAAAWHGTASFSFLGWDRTWGTAGATAPIPSSDPGSPFTANEALGELLVTPVNHRPVQPATPAPVLLPVAPNPAVPAGQLVAGLVARATDVDGDTVGSAITGSSGTGTWQYSIDGGSTWTAVGAVSSTAALLLSPTDLVRFVPSAGASGFGSLTVKAWDQTTGTHGTRVNTTLAGLTAYSTSSATAVSRINTAPVLAGAASVLSMSENQTPNAGFAISTLLTGHVTDKASSLQGIAITDANNGNNGIWQYSINGGTTWLPLPSVSVSAALLLRSTDKIRFSPNADFHGANAATLSYRAWDQTYGAAGTTADVSNFYTGAFFSSAGLTATMNVNAVPIAPRLVANVRTALPSFLPGGMPTSSRIGDLLAGLVSHPTLTTFGVAVTGLTGDGIWVFNLDGSATWAALGAVSGTSVRLLDQNARVGFIPSATFRGIATFTFRAWDLTGGTSGALFTIPTGSAAFSTTGGIGQVAVNTAPILDTAPNPALPTIPSDTTNPVGTSVSTLLGTAFNDPDGTKVLRGIAVTGVTGTANGSWQFSASGAWQNVVAASDSSALLLRSTDKLRFVPAANWNGQATVSYRAWDLTTGTFGGRANASTNGGSSAFSTATDVATETVTPINHRPTTLPGYVPGMLHLPSESPNTTTPQGIKVSDLIGAWVIDVDGNGVGIAASGLTNTTHGTWQFSEDGVSWQAIGTVSTTSALLLADSDFIRFVPNAGFNGSAEISFRAWDQTIGIAGSRVALSSTTLGDSLGLASLAASVWVNTPPEFMPG
jgi:hypothetical protein